MPKPLTSNQLWIEYVFSSFRFSAKVLFKTGIAPLKQKEFNRLYVFITFAGMEPFDSKILNEVTNHFNDLPGVGKKSAIRFALMLLKQDKSFLTSLAESINKLATNIVECNVCYNIADEETCKICQNEKRDSSVICVVQDIRDIMAIENTQQYSGKYHVLGGVISPMDGIGPSDIKIEQLKTRVEQNDAIKEIILALPATMEGDTTNFYISKKLNGLNVKLSTVARGIGFGDQIEYTDEVTLGKSIINRIPYSESSL